MRSLRRCSWFSTCAHCVLIALVLAHERVVRTPRGHAGCDEQRRHEHRRSNVSSHHLFRFPFSILHSAFKIYQPAPPPPPPLRPPPNPPKAAAKATATAAAESTAAEWSDAAVPAAPPAAAPSRPEPAPPRTADGVEDDEDDEEGEDEISARSDVGRAAGGFRPDALQRHVAPLRDARNDAGDAGEQPGAVRAAAELRRHVLPADLAGKTVGDELLEVVADFDPDLAIVDREQHEGSPLSFPRCPIPRPWFSNILTAYSRMSP